MWPSGPQSKEDLRFPPIVFFSQVLTNAENYTCALDFILNLVAFDFWRLVFGHFPHSALVYGHKKNSPEKKKNYRTDFNTIQMNKKERGYSFPCILTPMNARIFHAAVNNRSNYLIPSEKIRWEKSLKLVPAKYKKKIYIHGINFSGKS